VPSVFAWLDSDDDQRRRMLAVVELFKDEGTVDELGIGAIRDTIADVLFPGTSVLHTRARYLLFVPWLLRAAEGMTSTAAAVAELRRLEIRLIQSLLDGGETRGVIGRQAKERLKRTPSAAYWAAIRRFGIRAWDTTVEGHFRMALSAERARRAEPERDDVETASFRGATGLDPNLPAVPADLFTGTSFRLSAIEADFLRDHILATTDGSLLAWLLAHRETTAGDYIWLHPACDRFPAGLRELIEHGRRFHAVTRGAALLYNLMLAERRESAELSDRYAGELAEWQQELPETAALNGWDLDGFWAVLRHHNPRIREMTRVFVTRWVERVSQGVDVGEDDMLRELIRRRELQLKGGRARLVNASALDAWKGGSGLVPLDYRWGVARRLLGDILGAENG
jgi:hypothetical protein